MFAAAGEESADVPAAEVDAAGALVVLAAPPNENVGFLGSLPDVAPVLEGGAGVVVPLAPAPAAGAAGLPNENPPAAGAGAAAAGVLVPEAGALVLAAAGFGAPKLKPPVVAGAGELYQPICYCTVEL